MVTKLATCHSQSRCLQLEEQQAQPCLDKDREESVKITKLDNVFRSMLLKIKISIPRLEW